MESLVAVTTRVVPVGSTGACAGRSVSTAGWAEAADCSFSLEGEAGPFACGDGLCRFAEALDAAGFFFAPDAVGAGDTAPFLHCWAVP